MISNTLIPLYQFTRWLGLNGFDSSGINRDGCKKCCCFLQHEWQKPTHWSRDSLIESLQLAEDLVISWSKVYPNRFQITEEHHEFKGFVNQNRLFNSYRPRRPIEAFEYGLYSVDFESNVSIDWTNLGIPTNSYPDVITLSLPISSSPIQISEKNVRIYYTENDFSEREISFNSHLGEIRPFRKITMNESENIDGTFDYSIQVDLDSFLLTKPENWEIDECCENAYDLNNCYVDSVDFFIEKPDCCAYYLTENENCTTNCEDARQCACVYQRNIQDELWFVPQAYDCETETRLCFPRIPSQVVFNYVSGYQPDNNKFANRLIANATFMLAVGLSSCIKEDCTCEICFKKKYEYYRNPDMYEIRKSTDTQGEYDTVNEILKDRFDSSLAKGLMQNRGIISAFSILRKLKLNPIGVKYGQ